MRFVALRLGIEEVVSVLILGIMDDALCLGLWYSEPIRYEPDRRHGQVSKLDKELKAWRRRNWEAHVKREKEAWLALRRAKGYD